MASLLAIDNPLQKKERTRVGAYARAADGSTGELELPSRPHSVAAEHSGALEWGSRSSASSPSPSPSPSSSSMPDGTSGMFSSTHAPSKALPPSPMTYYETALIFAAVSLGAYAGALTRLGLHYYRGAAAVLYANIIGSLVLGVASEYQAALLAGPRLHRLLVFFTGAGFCGSLTSFSSYSFESSKLIFLQTDSTYASIGTTWIGGRALEWLAALWGGVLLPLAALQGGQHAVQALKAWRGAQRAAAAEEAGRGDGAAAAAAGKSALPSSTVPSLWYVRMEVGVLLAWLAVTAVVIALPVVCAADAFITYTAVFGSVGAYLRFRASVYNKRLPGCCTSRFPRVVRTLGGGLPGQVPVGTFAVNAVGTWVLASVVAASRFSVSYWDRDMQGVLYGIATGFCGSLTTMSTFVLELHTLPRARSYVYALASIALAQLACVALWGSQAAAFAGVAVPSAIAPHLSPCGDYPLLCKSLLDSLGCPSSAATVAACPEPNQPPIAFRGVCTCGALDASERLAELMIDAQVLVNVSTSLVPAWTAPPDGSPAQPLEVFEVCLSFENVCDAALNAFNCPPSARRLNSCDRRGLPAFVGLCACGSWDLMGVGNGVDGRVSELMIDYTLHRRYDFNSHRGFVTTPLPLDYCAAVQAACHAYLDHSMCPPAQRVTRACRVPTDVTTFEGDCSCFKPGPASNRLPQTVMDSFMKPNTWPRLKIVSDASSSMPIVVDGCASFDALCVFLQDYVGCPLVARAGTASCNATYAPTGPSLSGSIASPAAWIGACLCGEPTSPLSKLMSTRVREYIIDGAIAGALEAFVLRPPPTQAYPLQTFHNPWRPFLAPLYPLPGTNLVP